MIRDKPMTIKEFCDRCTWTSESAIRNYAFRAKDLGISDAFVRIDRHLFVIPSKMLAFIRKMNKRKYRPKKWETFTI